MTHAIEVFGFGAIAVDEILYVDRPLSEGKGKIVDRIVDHGGNVATALVAVAKLGGRAGFIGWLNDRSVPDPSARELERHGVDTSLAPRRADARPIRSVITVGTDGERFVAYDDDVPHGTSDAVADETLALAKVLLVDGYATRSLDVVARARALGLAVVADVEWTVGAETERLIGLADHLVLPYGFAKSYTSGGDPAEILHGLWSEDRVAVVLTDGDRGAYVLQKGDARPCHIPAQKVTVVDTTGAGDCFHGAYAFALTEEKSPISCALYASAAAALSVTGKGGRMALPDRDACIASLAGPGAPEAKPIDSFEGRKFPSG